ncbi:MAG: hypothetical protein A2750_03020 [Candidatus Yanofskybacteria bacterium RIFCSPHIGHO2_01_FULL_45_42]|uniref:Uncharacterized protein n=3 Tax=Candidatus Yanofskyibacteriota TaxID=1752733 RepID=A0A1F8FKF1_9BACT|nr:MAG: hypothetical protein A2750_03020 [Candidatus Yanofskybacteria bacterium RIFCSPHIGHO2_01_FULL_45_42]OGN13584.1 MAG: hypothetical protein A3J47_02925 [Candidatus Yanofskybacteria bacterium RIFCSPHIGHO2_02_FULL_43_22]OGN31642.1 MAG: hypothetical protein A3J01_01940 [Candidatus Yanofskybacteria bacterium RIFCSPLOWO2_02_FULL_45_18]
MQLSKEQLEKLKLIKDFKIALRDLELMVKNPAHLWNGRDLKNFSLRPREAWANWLICVVLRHMHKRDITFMEDDKGDGFIVDKERIIIVPTEHVSALNIPKGKKLPSGEQRVIDAIDLKIAKGIEYAKGKLLVVFFDGAGEFYRNRIRESIFGRHSFEAVFCVGLLDSSEKGYSYSVTEFRDSFGDQSVTHKVEISGDFIDWKISQVIQ